MNPLVLNKKINKLTKAKGPCLIFVDATYDEKTLQAIKDDVPTSRFANEAATAFCYVPICIEHDQHLTITYKTTTKKEQQLTVDLSTKHNLNVIFKESKSLRGSGPHNVIPNAVFGDAELSVSRTSDQILCHLKIQTDDFLPIVCESNSTAAFYRIEDKFTGNTILRLKFNDIDVTKTQLSLRINEQPAEVFKPTTNTSKLPYAENMQVEVQAIHQVDEQRYICLNRPITTNFTNNYTKLSNIIFSQIPNKQDEFIFVTPPADGQLWLKQPLFAKAIGRVLIKGSKEQGQTIMLTQRKENEYVANNEMDDVFRWGNLLINSKDGEL